MFNEAPKEEVPSGGGPMLCWTCIFGCWKSEAREVKKNEPILSGLLSGTPFSVTLIRSLSDPLMVILVYPIPAQCLTRLQHRASDPADKGCPDEGSFRGFPVCQLF